MTDNTAQPAPSVLPRAAIALVGPAILAVLYLPIFRSVQGSGVPTGSLEGIDMTPFAERDERMMLIFAGVLILFVIIVSVGARSWRHRLVVGLVGAVAGFVSYWGLVFGLFVG